MTARATFEFGEFTLRPARPSIKDCVLAVQWTQADPRHSGTIPWTFWLEQGEHEDAYVLLDALGPVLFFKACLLEEEGEKRGHLFVQFPPEAGAGYVFERAGFGPALACLSDKEIRARVRAGLLAGVPWLAGICREAGIEEIFFDSDEERLIEFSTKRLGFTRDGRRLRMRLDRQAGAEGAAHVRPDPATDGTAG